MNEVQVTDTPSMRIAWRAGYLLAAFGIFMVDQVTKSWATRTLRFTGDLTIINRFLDFVYTENRGIAFGQLQQTGRFGRWFFVGLAITAAVVVLVYFFRTPRIDDRILGACALLLGGITGNLTDRVRFGYVIDFIVVHWHDHYFAVFNLADSAIFLGAV